MAFLRIFRLRNNDSTINLEANNSEQNDESLQLNPECELLLSENGSLESTSDPVQEISDENVNNSSMVGDLRVTLPSDPIMGAPPPYEEVERNSFSPLQTSSSLGQSGGMQPPTYEEVQRQKALEAGEDPICIDDPTSNGMQVVRLSPLSGLESQTTPDMEDHLLGTDHMFFVAFTAAFLFNVVGIVLLLCLCHTVAGRTGALAGFGLSLAKWVVICRNTSNIAANESKAWLLWLIMVLGLVVCVRAIMQYVCAKRKWMQLSHASRQRFLLLY